MSFSGDVCFFFGGGGGGVIFCPPFKKWVNPIRRTNVLPDSR